MRKIRVGPVQALRQLLGFHSESLDTLNEHTEAIECHVERFIALDKRLTDVERYAHSINSVFGGQVNDLADRIAKLEDRLSSLEGTHVNASVKHADRLDRLEANYNALLAEHNALCSMLGTTLWAVLKTAGELIDNDGGIKLGYSNYKGPDFIGFSDRPADDRPANPATAQG